MLLGSGRVRAIPPLIDVFLAILGRLTFGYETRITLSERASEADRRQSFKMPVLPVRRTLSC